MNRGILFRGKSIQTGQWIEGSLLVDSFTRDYFIIEVWDGDEKDLDYIKVEPESVGQFTGLKDSSERLIFEGDIIKCCYFKMGDGGNDGVTELDETLIGCIKFDRLSLIVNEINCKKWSEYTGYPSGEGSCRFIYLNDIYEGSEECEENIKIIGNIHDNHELMEVAIWTE